MITEKQFLDFIRKEYDFKRRGGQQAFADQFSIGRSHVSGMMSGKVKIPKRVVRQIGFRRVTLYERIQR